jgi:HAE1 family hydrophobic/amphiphilic exporter-1
MKRIQGGAGGFACLLFVQTLHAQDPASPALPPREPLQVPTRIGVLGQTSMSLAEVIQRALANNRDLAVSQILRKEAVLNIKGAKGYYDPNLGVNAFRNKTVSPVSSVLGGSADGRLTQKELYADPEINGLSPFLGGTYKLDFSSARQFTDSEFATLNPQFPTALNLNLTQPLWRGLRFDANRYRVQVARKNQKLTDEQFRRRVIEVTTQAIQAYWELSFAYRNLSVQIEAVRLAELQDSSNRRQVDQGLLAPADVIQTQTQIATYQQNVFTAQDALTRAENNLKALILATRQDLLWGAALIPETLPDTRPVAPSLDDAVHQALSARPELAESALNIEINKLDAKLSHEQAKPQIDAQATLGIQGLAGRPVVATSNPFSAAFTPLITDLDELLALSGLPPAPPISFGSTAVPPMFVGGYGKSLEGLKNGTFPTAQVGVQFNFPIRNRTAEANQAVSILEGKRLQTVRDQLAMSIEADVRNTLQALESSRARLAAAVLARKSADDQYASEQRQFQAGTSSVFLVLQRQTDLISARSREARAEADLGIAAADFDRATARTIETQNISIQ